MGRKNGKGFYDYAAGQAEDGYGRTLPVCGQEQLTREQVGSARRRGTEQRFLVVQAVEAARTFEEKVVTDVREADVGSILGWGFAPYSGGVLSYIDMMGTKKFVELCRKFEKNMARASRLPSCSSIWLSTTKRSTAVSRRGKKKEAV